MRCETGRDRLLCWMCLMWDRTACCHETHPEARGAQEAQCKDTHRQHPLRTHPTMPTASLHLQMGHGDLRPALSSPLPSLKDMDLDSHFGTI